MSYVNLFIVFITVFYYCVELIAKFNNYLHWIVTVTGKNRPGFCCYGNDTHWSDRLHL